MPKQLDTVSRQPASIPPAKPTPEVSPSAAAPETSTDPASQDDYNTLFPEPSVAINPPPNWIWWLLVLVCSGLIGAFGYQYIKTNLKQWLSVQPPVASASASPVLPSPSPSPSITPTPSPTLTPSPSSTPTSTPSATPSPSITPTPSIQKSSITLRVLNGTTKNGAAAAAQQVLINNGFQVRTIGNARTQTYTKTYIYYQTGKLAEAEAVKAAMTNYSPTLEEDTQTASPDMVLVVVGP